MWNRKELKRNARKTVKACFFTMLCTFFILVILGIYDSVSANIIVGDDNVLSRMIDSKNQETGITNELTQIISKDLNTTPIQIITRIAGLNQNIWSKALDVTFSFMNNYVSGAVIFIVMGVLFVIYNILFKNILYIGSKRYLMEARLYHGTNAGRIFFLYREKKVFRPAWILLTKFIFTFLWCFTVVGGVIKHYQYKMIPFLIAENPDIDRKTAFKLSKEMMMGNKWQAFLLDVSMLGWRILGVITFGIFDIVFGYSYIYSVETELYTTLRSHILATNAEYNEFFCNGNLFTIPEKYEYASSVAKKQCYPGTKRPVKFANEFYVRFNYHRKYTIWSYIMMFFVFSFIGWVWEVILFMFTKGEFINRGVLFGPVLPIYGFGGIFVLVFIHRFADNKILTFFLSLTVCTSLEYVSSWALEEFFGTRWWDYSQYFLNINGRVCLEGAIVFGLGGCAFIYVLAPFFDTLIRKFNKKLIITVSIVLIVLFCCDLGYSYFNPNTGEGIDDFPTKDQQPTKVSVIYEVPQTEFDSYVVNI